MESLVAIMCASKTASVSSFHFPLNTIRVLIVDDKGDICQEYKLLDFFKLVKLI